MPCDGGTLVASFWREIIGFGSLSFNMCIPFYCGQWLGRAYHFLDKEREE